MSVENVSAGAFPFEQMANAARKLIRRTRRDKYFSDETFAGEACVDSAIVKALLSDKDEDKIVLNDIQGKDWEKLMTVSQVFPEDWINETIADLKGSGKAAERYEFLSSSKYVVSSGRAPTEAADKTIRELLGWTNSFYLEASSRYIKAHGSTVIRKKDVGNHEEGH